MPVRGTPTMRRPRYRMLRCVVYVGSIYIFMHISYAPTFCAARQYMAVLRGYVEAHHDATSRVWDS
jgi:hypothetical protein